MKPGRIARVATAVVTAAALYRVVAARTEWVEFEEGTWGLGLAFGRNEDDELVVEVALARGSVMVLLAPARTVEEE